MGVSSLAGVGFEKLEDQLNGAREEYNKDYKAEMALCCLVLEIRLSFCQKFLVIELNHSSRAGGLSSYCAFSFPVHYSLGFRHFFNIPNNAQVLSGHCFIALVRFEYLSVKKALFCN